MSIKVMNGKELAEYLANHRWFQIFEVGTYPQGSYTQADLDEMVANYNAEQHLLPITLDHAEAGPSYGWLVKLKREGGRLFGAFDHITDELKRFVTEGKYRYFSVELFRSVKNKLRAVSLLGAATPQLNLPGVDVFARADNDVICFDTAFDEVLTPDEQGETAKMRDEVVCFLSDMVKGRWLKPVLAAQSWLKQLMLSLDREQLSAFEAFVMSLERHADKQPAYETFSLCEANYNTIDAIDEQVESEMAKEGVYDKKRYAEYFDKVTGGTLRGLSINQ